MVEGWARATRKTFASSSAASPSSNSRPLCSRALEPFPTPVRTLDALHLASIEFLRGLGQRPMLATYDHRLAEAAALLDISLATL